MAGVDVSDPDTMGERVEESAVVEIPDFDQATIGLRADLRGPVPDPGFLIISGPLRRACSTPCWRHWKEPGSSLRTSDIALPGNRPGISNLL